MIGLLDEAAYRFSSYPEADNKMIRIKFPEIRHHFRSKGIGNEASGAETCSNHVR